MAAVVLPVNQFDRTKIELINNRRLDKLHAVDVCDHCQTKRRSLTVVTLLLDNYAGFGTRQSTRHISSPHRDHQIKWITRHHALAAAVCTMNLVLHPAMYQDFAANQTEMSVQIAS